MLLNKNKLDNFMISSTLLFQGTSFLLGVLKIKILTTYLDVSTFGIYSVLYPTLNMFVTLIIFGSDRFLVRAGTSIDNVKLLKALYYYLIILLLLMLLFINFVTIEIPIINLILALFLLSIAQLNRNSIFALEKITPYNCNTFLINNHWLIILLFPFLKIEVTINNLIYAMNTGFLIAIIFSFFYLELRKFFHIKTDLDIIKRAFLYSTPLLPYVLGQALTRMSDRYTILYFLNAEYVGYYNFVYTLIATVTTFSAVVLEVFRPKIFKAKLKNEVFFLIKKMLIFTALFTIPCLIGLLFYAQEIILFLSSSQYLNAFQILPLLIILPLLTSWTTIIVYLCEKEGKNNAVGKAYVVNSLLNVILNISLVNFYGVKGAAYAVIISSLVTFVMLQYKVNFFAYFDREEQCRYLLINFIFVVCLLIIKNLNISLINSVLIAIISYFIFVFIIGKNQIKNYYF